MARTIWLSGGPAAESPSGATSSSVIPVVGEIEAQVLGEAPRREAVIRALLGIEAG